MKYYISKTTNIGKNEIMGPFTSDDADEIIRMELRNAQTIGEMNHRDVIVVGSSIYYDSGLIVHYVKFPENSLALAEA